MATEEENHYMEIVFKL